MKHKTKQDQDELFQRLESVKKVEPSEFLFAKIRYKIAERKKDNNVLTPQFAWRMAAVFVVLLLVNIFVLFMNPEEVSQETTMVVEELGLVSDNYDNY